MKKRILSAMLVLAMVLSMAACKPVEEEKKNHISLIWIASASFFILIVSVVAVLVIKEELPSD